MAQKKTAGDAISVFRSTDRNGRIGPPGSGGPARGSGPGTVDGVPFTTKDGKPRGQDPVGGTFNMSEQNRLQGEETGKPSPPMPHMVSRPQHTGSAEERIRNTNIPSDGLTPPAKAPPSRASTGSVGVSRVPFKNMKG